MTQIELAEQRFDTLAAISAEDVKVTVKPTTKEERATLQRAATLKLRKRLTLGLSIEAMESQIAALPPDAVDKCNKHMPTLKNKQGETLSIPANKELNGYVNQYHIIQASKADGLATCERLMCMRDAIGAEEGKRAALVDYVGLTEELDAEQTRLTAKLGALGMPLLRAYTHVARRDEA